jgi:hypothetical protein
MIHSPDALFTLGTIHINNGQLVNESQVLALFNECRWGQGSGQDIVTLHTATGPVAYPGLLFGGGFQQIQLWTEGRENEDLEAVAT